MKKTVLFLLLLLLLLLALTGAQAEKVSYQGFETESDAEYIYLDGVRVKDWNEFARFLYKLPNLKRCDMFDTTTRLANAEMLSSRFPDVEFGWTLEIVGRDHTHRFRSDCTAFSTLHNNRSTSHTSADFEIFKFCPNLLALDIGHNSGVKDVSFLQYTPNLKVLIMIDTNVSDITPIGELKDLEYLEIFKNQIKDITPLANLTNLIDLNICFNYISDWTPLYGLTQLDRLWMYNSNSYSQSNRTPKKVVEELKKRLPNTQIDWQHYSTGGGWRYIKDNVPFWRYDIINTMFRSGVYIPFNDPEEVTTTQKQAEYTNQ